MPRFVSADQLAYDRQQAAILQAQEDAKREHFRRMADPMAPILARLEQLQDDHPAGRAVSASAVPLPPGLERLGLRPCHPRR